MSLVMPKENSATFEKIQPGTYPATCYRVIDLGTQQTEWKGKVKRNQKIMLSWEMTDEKMADGRPFTIHQRYTMSSSEKSALRHDLESWRGIAFTEEDFGNFNVGNLLGKGCLMGVVHESKDGKTYENISSILGLPKGMTASTLVNPMIQFDLSNFDQAVYDSLSESLQAVIAKSPEYQELKGATNFNAQVPEARAAASVDDEIPF